MGLDVVLGSGGGEDLALRLLMVERKSAVEVSRVLRERGFDWSPQRLRNLKARSFQVLLDEQREEVTADFLLKSMDKVMFEFEDQYSKVKGLVDKFYDKGEYDLLLSAMKQQNELLTTAMKRLGEYKSGIEKISAKQVNIVQGSDVVQALKAQQQRWFSEMQPEVKDGKLIFHQPLPEVLDEFARWKFKSGKN